MRILFWAGFGAFMVDQAGKYLVVHWMELSRLRVIELWPPILMLRYGENRGINFGLLDVGTDLARWLLIGVSLLVVGAIYVWIRRWHPSPRMQLSAGLLIGGALGNVTDRLVYGYVRDFLNMSCCGIDNPYVFNLADVFIFAGVVGLMLFEGGGRVKNAP